MVVVPLVPLYSHSFAEPSKTGQDHPSLKDCINIPLRLESQVETQNSLEINPNQKPETAVYYWLAETPDSLNVSGGSKKH